jgi:hypothetical protein
MRVMKECSDDARVGVDNFVTNLVGKSITLTLAYLIEPSPIRGGGLSTGAGSGEIEPSNRGWLAGFVCPWASFCPHSGQLAEATTSSLEALKAFSLGGKAYYEKGVAAALLYHQRAIALDPNFAMAYSLQGSGIGLRPRR